MIHGFLDHHNYPAEQFTYSTGNFKIRESYHNWCVLNDIAQRPINFFISNYWIYHIENSLKTFSSDPKLYYFTNLNNAPYYHRVMLYKKLYDASDLLDKSITSMLNPPDGYPRMVCDDLVNKHWKYQGHLFKDSYFSVITESNFHGNAAYDFNKKLPAIESWHAEGHITEKTWKAVTYLHPFVMVGASGALKDLHRRGFKTFDGWIDESYDSEEDPFKRLDMVFVEIKKLCDLSPSEIHEWYLSLKNVLLYNQKVYYEYIEKYKSLSPTDLY